MTRPKRLDPKAASLRRHGCLNPWPERVTAPDFVAAGGFFDPRDLIQVKYEMLRRVRVEGESVSASAAAFGFSRPTYYQADGAFLERGLPGLVPSKRGPRRAHKLSDEILDFLEKKLAAGEASGSSQLAELVKQRLGLEIHPRSVERALARRQEKKRRRSQGAKR
jgi:transposase